jgi:hypothetical protein
LSTYGPSIAKSATQQSSDAFVIIPQAVPDYTQDKNTRESVENVSQIEMADQENLLRTTPTSLGMSQMDPATQITHGPPTHNDFCPEQATTEETREVPSHFADISQHQIDHTIQQQCKDLHELLQLFKQAYTEPLSSFILQTPKHKSGAKK